MLPRTAVVLPQPIGETLVGTVVGERFELVDLIGTGAMAAVYRARHLRLQRPFAVKVMHARLAISDKLVERFEREVQLGGLLAHPNLVAVVDAGEIAGLPYLVMELADGRPLSQIIDEQPLPREQVLAYAKQICDGLEHAHAAGITHRDFKPDNVIVERDGRVRILDFGIAMAAEARSRRPSRPRLTTDGLVVGTPAYMAPEHARGEALDARADLYSFGITMYEMLTGRVPFDGDGVDVAIANVHQPLPPMRERAPHVKVDPFLEAFTRMLLVKSRDERIPSARRARELLELIERDGPAAERALGMPPSRSRRTPRVAMPRLE